MVCGGAGFIGSHFIEYLLKKHPKDFVLCYDKLTYAGKKENLFFASKNPNFVFVKGDICDKNFPKPVWLPCWTAEMVPILNCSRTDRPAP